jgi:hydroxymethylbilane synthase
VAEAALKIHPGLTVEIRPIVTSGDDLLARPKSLGLKGLFVKEIELALLSGEIDVAIHSAKDLPLTLPEGLKLGPIPKRGPVEDALVAKEGLTLADLPKGAIVGTSSLRRGALLLSVRPDLKIAPIRGNVDTRLLKLKEGPYVALTLALAGLTRLKRAEWPRQILSPEKFPPSPGQGTLALEIRADDFRVLKLLEPLNDPVSALSLALERGAAEAIGAGCSTPAAAYAKPLKDGEFVLIALVASASGQKIARIEEKARPATLLEAREAGLLAGEKLLKAGGAAILAELSKESLERESDSKGRDSSDLGQIIPGTLNS